MWGRIGVLVLVMIVGLAASIGLIVKVVHPYREVAVNQQALASINEQISQLDAQNDDLRQRIAYLKTTPGKITEARKLGYTKPGEIPIVVEGMPTTWSDSPPVQTSGSPGWRDKARSLWHSLVGR
jgi:cell division protein FtsB